MLERQHREVDAVYQMLYAAMDRKELDEKWFETIEPKENCDECNAHDRISVMWQAQKIKRMCSCSTGTQ